MSNFIPTPEQRVIIGYFAGDSTRNGCIDALAGTGKTTTILAAVAESREFKLGLRILLTAFNKKIADELTARITALGWTNVEARTLNALAYASLRSERLFMQGNVRPQDKMNVNTALTRIFCQDRRVDLPYETFKVVQKLQELGRKFMFDHFEYKTALGYAEIKNEGAAFERLTTLGLEFDAFPEDMDHDTRANCVDAALYAVGAATARNIRHGVLRNIVDFTDQLFLPLVWNTIKAEFDLVVVDEAQDLSDPLLEIAFRSCKDSGRIVMVGDPNQAIYNFAGVKQDSFDSHARDLDCERFTLSVTHRCPKSVVELAQNFVPSYVAADTAKEGKVEKISYNQVVSLAQANNFIVSRKKAPLASLAIALLKEGKTAIIRGSDVAAKIENKVKSFKKNDVKGLLEALSISVENEIEALAPVAKKNEDLYNELVDRIQDEAALIHNLCEGLSKTSEVLGRISELFSEYRIANAIELMTTHKAKGLEAEVVFMLDYTYSVANQEERNLNYVAITRAKDTLYRVSSPKA